LGEIISLWGSIGLVTGSVFVALSVCISVGLAGILGVLAIDRLISQPASRSMAIFRRAWIAVLCGVALSTFFWIMAAVHIEH
jgi:hypothetical protein